jgi:hypothetical protein
MAATQHHTTRSLAGLVVVLKCAGLLWVRCHNALPKSFVRIPSHG